MSRDARSSAAPVSSALPMFDALTGLRIVAAVWVVLHHFRDDIGLLFPSSASIQPLLEGGNAGVDLFFILSGFIIAYTYLERLSVPRMGTTGRFLWLRLARIYPVHVATLVLFAVALAPGRLHHTELSGVAANFADPAFYRQLAMVHTWQLDHGNPTWNYPAWSISSEWFAYLVFPLGVLGLRRVTTSRGALIGLLSMQAMNIFFFSLLSSMGYAADFAVTRVLCEFFMGCFLFILWRERWAFGRHWQLLAPLLLAAAAAGAALFEIGEGFGGIAVAPLFCFAIYGLAVDGGPLGRALSSRAAIYAGAASYSLYMTHALVERFTGAYLPAASFADDALFVRVGVLALYVLLMGAVAVVTYECVEEPSRRWMRSLDRRRDARAAMPARAPEPPAQRAA